MTAVARYGDEAMLSLGGALLPSTSVVVLNLDTTMATLYTDATGSVGGSGAPYNPVNTNTRGNLSFFAASGSYLLQIGGVTVAEVSVVSSGVDPTAVHLVGLETITGPKVFTDATSASNVSLRARVKRYYLDPANGNDANDGQSSGSALATIPAVITALAGTPGSVHFLPGIYPLTAMATFVGNVNLFGEIGGWVGGGGILIQLQNPGAGVEKQGGNSTEVSHLTIDATGVATAPYKRTLLSGSGGYCNHRNLTVQNAAGATNAAVSVLGPQNDKWDVLTILNPAGDGLYLDKGASGHLFTQIEVANSGRYAIHGNVLIPGGPSAGPLLNRFVGGMIEQLGGGGGGVSQVYLRGCGAFIFVGANIQGATNSGPVLDLDLNTGYGHDFSGCTVGAGSGAGSPGHVCAQVDGANPFFMQRTIFTGDTSIYVPSVAHGLPIIHVEGMFDNTTNGPVSGGGIQDANTFLRGKNGPWITPAAAAGWTSPVIGYQPVQYRINASGAVEFRGSAFGVNGTAAFVVQAGYRPQITAEVYPVITNGGTGIMTVDGTTGNAVPAQVTGTTAAGVFFTPARYPTR